MKIGTVTRVDYEAGEITITGYGSSGRTRRARPKHRMRSRRLTWTRIALEPGVRIAQFQRGMRIAIMPAMHIL